MAPSLIFVQEQPERVGGFVGTVYRVELDGREIGTVRQERQTRDLNHLNGGRRGNARMSTRTVWRFAPAPGVAPAAPRSGGFRSEPFTWPARQDAVRAFLAGPLGMAGDEYADALEHARTVRLPRDAR